MKKSKKPETTKKPQQTSKEQALNKELLKVEKAFATGLRAGPIGTNQDGGTVVDDHD
jgi:hypothetical protein